MDHFGDQFDIGCASVARLGGKPPARRRARFERDEVLRVQRRDESVGIAPNPEAFGKDVPVHRHAGMQVRAEQTVVFGIHPPQVHTQPRHTANSVGQQDHFRFPPSGFGFRARARGQVRPSDFGSKKPDRAAHSLVRNSESFRDQLGIGLAGARRKTRDVPLANRNGLRVLRASVLLETQPRAEGHLVLDQQPMPGRNRCDAAAINQTPDDHLRQLLLPRRGVQGRDQIFTGGFLVQAGQGTEELFRVALDQGGQIAPVVRTDFLRFESFAEGVDGPSRPGASAPVPFAARAERHFGGRQAVTGGRRKRKCEFVLVRVPDPGGRLSQQVHFGVAQNLRDTLDRAPDERGRIGLLSVGVHQNEHDVGSVVGDALQGEDG